MKKTLHLWHRYLGLLVAIPLLVISLTGSVLVFKEEIDHWLMPELAKVDAQVGARLPYDQLRTLLTNRFRHYEIGSWEIFDDGHTADRIYLIKHGTLDWYKVYLDQYQGTVRSEPVPVNFYLTDWLLDLHYKFLIGETGLWITGVVSIILLFMGISGLVIYRQFWKKFFSLRLNVKRTAFFSDLHKLTGIWSAPILFVLGFTGAYWNISEIIHHQFEHHDEEKVVTGPLYNQALSLDAMAKNAQTQMGGFRATYLLFPFEEGRQITFFGEVGNIGVLSSEYSSTVTFNKDTGALEPNFDIREAPVFFTVVDSFRKLHFGYFAGFPSKMIWCLIGLTPLIFTITGCYLWLRRRKPQQSRKQVPLSAQM
ncbi:PepSY domain-containing protein [Pseudoalteromonas xiamenensis]|uniref:PepSY-associated TM helix domain-containing protein n=1 Tax=Pseudoalteromonas xiamenensis TaxID=882626 RepID=UPI0027E44DC6|nr:PepSY-associated TM helix domain-containing protein [Pseudoalteromonas xiamenensis]WMN60688.1 PepSY domain-containing protein [Pseudoalteromonas xiamenensis]WMN60785.1 PepSY domain-containing protein [Pseudoalteromonas xiamenensis]